MKSYVAVFETKKGQEISTRHFETPNGAKLYAEQKLMNFQHTNRYTGYTIKEYNHPTFKADKEA